LFFLRVTATVGQPFSLAPTLSGFSAPSFSLLSGSLPAGLTLNPATGVISGTPTGPTRTSSAVISAYENDAHNEAIMVIDVQAAPIALVTPIPTFSQWGLLILASMLVVLTDWHLRREQRRLPRRRA
jgi:hypothetical protein